MALPTRANVSRPRASGYSFRIDEHYFRGSIAPDRPLDITTADLQAQKVNTATGSEDLRNEFGEIFSRASFVGGEGLAFAHQRDLPDNAVARYFDSSHIDISNPTPGKPPKITLLPVTANVETSVAANLHLAYDGTALYMGKSLLPRRSTDFTATTPTFADDSTGAAVSVLDLTTLGADVYAAQGANKIYKRSGGAWAQLASAPTTQKVWGVKLLLLAATGTAGSVLSEINTGTGAETVRVTLPNGQSWLDVADCGKAILAAASDGSIYALTSVSGALTLQAQTPMPAGQVPYCVGFDGTYIFVGTREATPSGAIGRVYRMEFGSSTTYELGNATLLRQWGSQSATIDHSPRKIVASRSGVVWGINETGGSFLWRYDSASAGVSRHLDLGASGLVVDILSVSGRLFATVDAHGLRREQVGTFEASGYLMGPLGDLFSASQKSWAGALLDHEDVVANSRIELYYATDPAALSDSTSALWRLVKRVESGIDISETPLSGVDDRFLAGMVKLYANTAATVAPSVRGFAFRAYPGAGDVEISMAINSSDVVTIPGRRSLNSRGLGALIYTQLKGKEGRYAEVQVLSTGEIFRGVVKKVSTRMPTEATRGTPSVVTMVDFRGRRIDDKPWSVAILGIGTLGLEPLGGMEVAA